MMLLTKEISRKLPKLYETEEVALHEKVVVVKFFDPFHNWTWYATEYDPEDRVLFGYVCGLEKEWGYFSLDELRSVTFRGMPCVERDLHFKPTRFCDLPSYEPGHIDAPEDEDE